MNRRQEEIAFFKKLIYFHLLQREGGMEGGRERDRERNTDWLIVQTDLQAKLPQHSGPGQAKPRSLECYPDIPPGVRDPNTLSISCCFLGACISWKLYWKQGNWDLSLNCNMRYRCGNQQLNPLYHIGHPPFPCERFFSVKVSQFDFFKATFIFFPPVERCFLVES